jgi:hypothetical protein
MCAEHGYEANKIQVLMQKHSSWRHEQPTTQSLLIEGNRAGEGRLEETEQRDIKRFLRVCKEALRILVLDRTASFPHHVDHELDFPVDLNERVPVPSEKRFRIH